MHYFLFYRIVSAVEHVGFIYPLLALENRTFAYHVEGVDSFSQTIIDAITMATANDRLQFNIAVSSPPRLSNNTEQHTSGRSLANESGYHIAVSNRNVSQGQPPLIAVEQSFLANISCSKMKSSGCQHRLQFNIYSTGVLFQEPSNSNSSTSLVLDSWIIGIKVDDFDQIPAFIADPIVTLSFTPFSAVSIVPPGFACGHHVKT